MALGPFTGPSPLGLWASDGGLARYRPLGPVVNFNRTLPTPPLSESWQDYPESRAIIENVYHTVRAAGGYAMPPVSQAEIRIDEEFLLESPSGDPPLPSGYHDNHDEAIGFHPLALWLAEHRGAEWERFLKSTAAEEVYHLFHATETKGAPESRLPPVLEEMEAAEFAATYVGVSLPKQQAMIEKWDRVAREVYDE